MKLLPGFRFQPTDEELILHYLLRKMFSIPLPAAIITELELLSGYDPWDIPGSPEKERYFFCVQPAKRPHRASVSGYWKATGRDTEIIASGSNQVVGTKKTLVFNLGKPPNALKTNWFMHEYRVAGIFLERQLSDGSVTETEEWLICRIFRKGRSRKRERGTLDSSDRWLSLPDLTRSPSDAESSCVTEADDDDDDCPSSSFQCTFR